MLCVEVAFLYIQPFLHSMLHMYLMYAYLAAHMHVPPQMLHQFMRPNKVRAYVETDVSGPMQALGVFEC